MKNIIEIIFPKGKPVAKFNSEGDLVVGTYFRLMTSLMKYFGEKLKKLLKARKLNKLRTK
jgi:hypothetical protein